MVRWFGNILLTGVPVLWKLLERRFHNLNPYLIFAGQFKTMSHETADTNEKDFTKNWVNSSRFLFYLQVFCVLAFVLGGCYRLYNQRYMGTPTVEVQKSSEYKPDYK